MFVSQSDIKNVAEEYNWLKNETQKTKEVIESKGFPCVFGVQGHNKQVHFYSASVSYTHLTLPTICSV